LQIVIMSQVAAAVEKLIYKIHLISVSLLAFSKTVGPPLSKVTKVPD
jgi:hypothetical protein